jgi:hypothetical protein
MPKVIGRTPDGREILRHAPEEGCAWQCVTCGNYLRGRREVRGHWAICSRSHRVFRHLRTGRVHDQTVEGLFERVSEAAGTYST